MDAQMQISVPPALKEWLDKEAASKGFRTSSELVEDLLRKEQSREAHSRLEDELERIIDSEEPRAMTREDWEKIRAQGLRRINEVKRS